MTPGARISAAIEILDLIAEGQPVERALTNWARRSRFAGSKDRAAIRDHVFDVQRNLRSDAVRGGGDTGRQLMIGRLRAEEAELGALFSGIGHAPAPLSEEESATGAQPSVKEDIWNLPDWIVPEFERSLGDKSEAVALALQARAPISLRVNIACCTVADAITQLASDEVTAVPNPLCDTALIITEGQRRLRNGQTYIHGLVELQDASSQAAVRALPKGPLRILDYCAGGGGKALAMAALGHNVTAHDANPARMADLTERSARAGVQIVQVETDSLSDHAPFDVVFCDAPCSGSGAWRRSPAAKWTLTADGLAELNATQDDILDAAQNFVAPNGQLVFATCSVFACENEDRATAFLDRNDSWNSTHQTRIGVSDASDGFFHAAFSKLT